MISENDSPPIIMFRNLFIENDSFRKETLLVKCCRALLQIPIQIVTTPGFYACCFAVRSLNSST